jgi:CelD/BcsL family acetyltransferase involved in cellulose biosynthesis
MSVAAPQSLRRLNALNKAPARAAFARVDVLDNAESAWSALSEWRPEGGASFYQGEAFLRAWLGVFGVDDAVRPCFIVARDEDGAALALLPLGLFQFGPLRVAQFLGGKHSNYNLGLFRPDRVFSAHDVRALLDAAARDIPGGPHLYRLLNMPLRWRGAANPLLALPHRLAASRAYATELAADGEAFLAARLSADARKKLRKKEKRLMTLGALRPVRATGPTQVEAVLDAYFRHKAGHADGAVKRAAAGGTRALYRRLAGLDGAARAIELHALMLDDRIVATFGAGLERGRLQGMFISYDPAPDIAKSSPGELLLAHVLREACARGVSSFDLGVGDARYKTTFCNEVEPLADAIYAPAGIGRLAAPAFAFALAAKAAIKRNPRLWAMAKNLRGI